MRRLLRGPVGLGIGIVVLGASGYGFLTLTARMVSTDDYSALAALYLLAALVGPALFVPLEQEATRVVTIRLAHGEGTRDAILRLYRAVALVLLAVTVALAGTGPLLVERVFRGHGGLWWALLSSVLGYGASSVARGVFAAHRRLGTYGLMCGIDGMARLLPCAGLAAAGVSAPVPYGIAFGLGPVVGLAATMALMPVGAPGPRPRWRELAAGTSWLAMASTVSLTLANIGPVLATAMLPTEPGRASVFAFAFVLVRIPLFVVLGLQPLLLPALANAVAIRDMPRLRRELRRAVLLVGALGAVLVAVAAPVGGWLIRALFGDAPPPSAAILTLLAAGTLLATLVQVLQPALVAVASHRTVALAWTAGGVSFAAAFLLPVDPVQAATAAQLAAGLVTLAIMTLALRRHLNADAGTTRRDRLSPLRIQAPRRAP